MSASAEASTATHEPFSLPEEFIERRTAYPPAIFCLLLTAAAWGASWLLYQRDPQRFAFSYLFAFSVGFTLGLGSLFWVMLHHATNSSWSTVVRRQMENLASLLPWIFLLLTPVLIMRHDLYKWMTISEPGVDALLDNKRAYLNEPFFFVRAAFYALLFCGLALGLRRWSLRQDKDGDPRWTIRSQGWTYGLLLPFALTLTLAVIDYLMALNHHWFSTMWGVYIFAGSALNAMAVLIVVMTALRSTGHLEGVVTLEHFHLMGKLLFAFTVFWAYIAFSQFFLIWYANIPEETVYFLFRNTDAWYYFSLALVAGHFFAPFLILILRDVKRAPVPLSLVAVWTLLMHLVDMYLVVIPNYGLKALATEGFEAAARAAFSPRLSDFVALVAVLAPLAAIFLFRLPGRPLFPARDPRLQESLNTIN